MSESTHFPSRIRTWIQDWRMTRRALSDPVRRAILTGAGDDDDYIEVGSPVCAVPEINFDNPPDTPSVDWRGPIT